MSKSDCGNATLLKYGLEYYQAIGRLGGRPKIKLSDEIQTRTASLSVLVKGERHGEGQSLMALKRLYAERGMRQCLNNK